MACRLGRWGALLGLRGCRPGPRTIYDRGKDGENGSALEGEPGVGKLTVVRRRCNQRRNPGGAGSTWLEGDEDADTDWLAGWPRRERPRRRGRGCGDRVHGGG